MAANWTVATERVHFHKSILNGLLHCDVTATAVWVKSQFAHIVYVRLIFCSVLVALSRGSSGCRSVCSPFLFVWCYLSLVFWLMEFGFFVCALLFFLSKKSEVAKVTIECCWPYNTLHGRTVHFFSRHRRRRHRYHHHYHRRCCPHRLVIFISRGFFFVALWYAKWFRVLRLGLLFIKMLFI